MGEMTRLAVDPKVGGTGGFLPVHRVAAGALGPGFRAVGGPGHIGMAVDAGRIPVGGGVQRLAGELQGDGSVRVGADRVWLFVAPEAECLGGGHPFVGVDVGLPVAVQAGRRPGVRGAVRRGFQGP